MERVTALGSPFVRGVPPKETPPLSPQTQPQRQPPISTFASYPGRCARKLAWQLLLLANSPAPNPPTTLTRAPFPQPDAPATLLVKSHARRLNMEDAPRDLEQQLIDILRAAAGPSRPVAEEAGRPARQPERPQERPLLPPPPRRPEGGPPTRPRDRATPKERSTPCTSTSSASSGAPMPRTPACCNSPTTSTTWCCTSRTAETSSNDEARRLFRTGAKLGTKNAYLVRIAQLRTNPENNLPANRRRSPRKLTRRQAGAYTAT